MKTTLERSNLLKSLTQLQRVVERKSSMPILKNVYINADSDAIELITTDIDLEVRDSIAASVEQSGTVTADAQVLFDIVRKLPEGAQIEFENTGKDSTLNVNAGKSKFKLPILPHDTFPHLAADDLTATFEISASNLKSLIERTIFAISSEDSRYYLNGIYLHTVEADGGDKLLRAVTTDGHRLAQSEFPCPNGATEMPNVIMPKKTVAELQRLLDGVDDNVTVELSDKKLRVKIGLTVLTSKLVDGTFPEYSRVIPKQNNTELKIDCEAFTRAVDRVSTISNDPVKAIKLSLNKGKMVLTYSNPASGNATEELEVEYDGDKMDIGFNSNYLLDITTQLESDIVQFKLGDATQPAIVQNDNSESTLYVVMPMRV